MLENINEKMEYFLWGCGEFGNSFFRLFQNRINIKGYIDSKQTLWGGDERFTDYFA